MEKVKTRNEELFEVLLRRAAIDICSAEGEKIRNEQYKAEFSKEFEKNAAKIKRSAGRPERIKKAAKAVKNTLILLAAIFSVCFAAMLTQPSVSAAVKNVIMTVFDKYNKYTFYKSDMTFGDFNNALRLGYAPEGFELFQGYYFFTNVSLTYKDFENEKELFFDYHLADSGLSINIDNERHELSVFTRGGTEYSLYKALEKNENSILLWEKDGCVFMIQAAVDKDEILKMAENVR